jgi:hypothetical protein
MLGIVCCRRNHGNRKGDENDEIGGIVAPLRAEWGGSTRVLSKRQNTVEEVLPFKLAKAVRIQ